MRQNILMESYLCFVSMMAVISASFISCGSNIYKVPVNNDLYSVGGSLDGQIHSSRGWKTLPIPVSLSSQMTVEMREAISNAIHTWEEASGKTLFRVIQDDPRSGDDFKKLYSSLDDSITGHYLDSQWAQNTGKDQRVLATTLWENHPSDARYIVKADIRYNQEYYLLGDSMTLVSEGDRTIVDLESLALHEIGHMLGLGHVEPDDDPYSVMNPRLYIGEKMTTRKLSRGDVLRIRMIYPGGDISRVDVASK